VLDERVAGSPGEPARLPVILGMWVIAASIFMTLPTAVLGFRGLAPLLVIITLAAAVVWIFERRSAPSVGPVFLSFASFVALAAASCVWSPDPLASLRLLVSFAAALFAGWLLISLSSTASRADRRTIELALIFGGSAGFLLLLFEALSGGALTREIMLARGYTPSTGAIANAQKPGLTVAALFIWPWGVAIARRGRPIVAIVAMAAVGILLTTFESNAAVVAMLLGTAAALFALVRTSLSMAMIATALAVVVLAAPLIVRAIPDPAQIGSGLQSLPNSAVHRISIWHRSVDLIVQAPVLGHGFNSSRMFYGPETARDMVLLPDVPERTLRLYVEPIPLHPHSLVLQVWIETGFVGALLLYIALFSIVREAARSTQDATSRAAAFGATGSAVTVAVVSYGAWQSWWLGTLILLAFVTSLQIGRVDRAPPLSGSRDKDSRTAMEANRS
jgi:exopolysaccharide production protein ExoQ